MIFVIRESLPKNAQILGFYYYHLNGAQRRAARAVRRRAAPSPIFLKFEVL